MGEGKGPRGGGGRGQCGDGGRIALPRPIASADEIDKCWRAPAAQASAAPREDQPLTPAVAARRCRACQRPSSPSSGPQCLCGINAIAFIITVDAVRAHLPPLPLCQCPSADRHPDASPVGQLPPLMFSLLKSCGDWRLHLQCRHKFRCIGIAHLQEKILCSTLRPPKLLCN